MLSSVTLENDHPCGLAPPLDPGLAVRCVASCVAPTAYSNDGRILRAPISMGSPTICSEILECDRNRCRIVLTTLALQCIGRGTPRGSVVTEPTTGGEDENGHGKEESHHLHDQERHVS